jgi:NADH-quinone oxidoreductase subunit M
MLTIFLIFWPLLAALIVFALKQQARTIALIASVIELVVALAVAFLFVPDESIQFAVNLPWIQSIGVHFNVGIDGISLLLVLLTTGLVPFIILSSFGNPYSNPQTFYGLILLMQMALVGVFVALDGFLFYLFWEMALIPIYFICLIWGGEDRGRITLKFFIYTLAGSLVMLIALVYLYFQTLGTHTFEIQALYEAGRSLTPFEQGILFWAFFVAFAIKMPVFPFHTWQPDTYTVSPSQGTMLLSAIMLKMGIYGVIRWLIPVVPLGVQAWGFIAIVLSVIGMVYASIIALVQKDFKRLIAYSSIAHVGLISAGIFTLSKIGMQGAMVQMMSHGMVAFALFYVVELISQRAKTRAIAQLGGIRLQAPILTSVFLVILLGSIALPFTSGFVGEFLLINSLVQYQLVIGAMAGLTTILGAVYMLRSFQQSMLGETNSVTSTILDLTSQEKLVLYPIVILVIVFGIYPAPLLKISEAAVNNLLTIVSNYLALAK